MSLQQQPQPWKDKKPIRYASNKISKKVGYNILEISHQWHLRHPLGDRKLVIFDYIINEPAGAQAKIANHFTDGRQHNFSPVYISQSYNDVPSKIRQNFSHFPLDSPTTKRHDNLIAKENRVKSEAFEALRTYEHRNANSFLFRIALSCTRDVA